jgi:hypothetical protein
MLRENSKKKTQKFFFHIDGHKKTHFIGEKAAFSMTHDNRKLNRDFSEFFFETW